MAFGSFKVLGGDFKTGDGKGQLTGSALLLYDPAKSSFMPDFTYARTMISSVDIATEESVKRVGGTVGWAAAGGLLLGPVGLLAGALLGGRGKKVTFICVLSNGRKFLAEADADIYKKFLAATMTHR